MALRKELRVQRTAEAGLMFTSEEMKKMTAGMTISESEYPREVSRTLDTIARNAQVVGRSVCGAHCELVCSGTELTGQQTVYDGDLVARCTSRICSDAGIITAAAQFKACLENYL